MAHGDEPVRAHDLCEPARPRLDRRAVEPGALALALRERRRRALPIINYSGGTEISGGILCGTADRAAEALLASPGPCRAWPPTWSTTTGSGARRGRRAGHPPALARHDARLLERPASATSRPTGRAGPTSGSTATGPTIDDDGYWYILGRSDDTIKVAGKRLGPAEVESAAVAHPAVAEAAAIGVPDALKGEAVVVLRRAAPRRRGERGAARRDRGADRRRSWARRSSPRPCASSPTAAHAQRQDPAPPRPRPPTWARTPATSRRWRTPPRSRPSAPCVTEPA